MGQTGGLFLGGHFLRGEASKLLYFEAALSCVVLCCVMWSGASWWENVHEPEGSRQEARDGEQKAETEEGRTCSKPLPVRVDR